jgi:hypothetical protein
MATPAQLAQMVSDVTGVPLATIVDLDRRLVKGKLRTISGRGFNAARMTPLDAARLLTAVLASPQANVAVEAVERYMQTQVDRARSSDRLFTTTGLDDLAALSVRHSFVDALTALIASASTGSLAKLIAASDNGWIPQIEVFAFTRAVRGRIRIAGLPNGMTGSVEFFPTAAGEPPRAKRERRRMPPANDGAGDLEQSRRVTDRTILPIARLLVSESRDDRA